MSRTVKEWIAKNDDEKIPTRVQDRIYSRCDGRCCECGVRVVGKIRPAFDHIRALINGGQHRESNLQLLCKQPCHAEKTKRDVAEKSVSYRKRVKHLGFNIPRKKIKSRGFQKFEPQRTASRPIMKGYDT